MPHELPKLPYSYDALEPHIDAATMKVHHSGHHQAYTTKLNAALEKHPELEKKSVEDLLKDLNGVPDDIRGAVRNNGGGYFNHSMFWPTLAPSGGGEPSGDLAGAIDSAFGSFSDFKEKFNDAAAGLFGSGWTWLCVDSGGKLVITTTPNQDNPVSAGLHPILGLDMWEHAYYIKHQNQKGNYISAWWNVINWEQVAKNYANA